MRTFVLVFFILQLLRAVLHWWLLISKDYPRTQTFTAGEEGANILGGMAFAAWAAYLLWG